MNDCAWLKLCCTSKYSGGIIKKGEQQKEQPAFESPTHLLMSLTLSAAKKKFWNRWWRTLNTLLWQGEKRERHETLFSEQNKWAASDWLKKIDEYIEANLHRSQISKLLNVIHSGVLYSLFPLVFPGALYVVAGYVDEALCLFIL